MSSQLLAGWDCEQQRRTNVFSVSLSPVFVLMMAAVCLFRMKEGLGVWGHWTVSVVKRALCAARWWGVSVKDSQLTVFKYNVKDSDYTVQMCMVLHGNDRSTRVLKQRMVCIHSSARVPSIYSALSVGLLSASSLVQHVHKSIKLINVFLINGQFLWQRVLQRQIISWVNNA